jgi:hypothetical protein
MIRFGILQSNNVKFATKFVLIVFDGLVLDLHKIY